MDLVTLKKQYPDLVQEIKEEAWNEMGPVDAETHEAETSLLEMSREFVERFEFKYNVLGNPFYVWQAIAVCTLHFTAYLKVEEQEKTKPHINKRQPVRPKLENIFPRWVIDYLHEVSVTLSGYANGKIKIPCQSNEKIIYKALGMKQGTGKELRNLAKETRNFKIKAKRFIKKIDAKLMKTTKSWRKIDMLTINDDIARDFDISFDSVSNYTTGGRSENEKIKITKFNQLIEDWIEKRRQIALKEDQTNVRVELPF